MALTKINNNTLSAITGLPSAIATGKIGQVISSGIDYDQSTNSSSFQDVLSASGTVWETAITPSATSSKIFVMANLYMVWEQSGNANNRGAFQFLSKTGSGSYSAIQGGSMGNYDYGGNGVQSRQRVQTMFQISPSTTSAVTIKFQYNGTGGTRAYVNDGGINTSTVLLWELLA
tara:strand:+ start:231 stop:752 length:522 start_codon:yes stop_codon:yes gene_type:complete